MRPILVLSTLCALSVALIEARPAPAYGQEAACRGAQPHRESGESPFDAGKQILVISCDGLRGRAVYDDRSIALSVSNLAGQPVFGSTTPDAFALYEPLLRGIVAERPDVGAWTLSVRGYNAYGSRLAAAAAADAGWDGRNGRPRTGALAAYVVSLANRARVFEEVERLAGQLGWRVRLLTVENVELCRFPPESRAAAPCGGLMRFQLQR